VTLDCRNQRARIFVVGDVRHGSVKRVASGVGEGAVVVQFMHQYLRRSSERKDAGAKRHEAERRNKRTFEVLVADLRKVPAFVTSLRPTWNGLSRTRKSAA